MPRYTAEQKAQRLAEVVRLRRGRMSFDEIGKRLDVDRSVASRMYQEALTHHPLTELQVDEHRVEQLELTDLAVRDLMKIAADSRVDKNGRALVSPRTRVEAWSAIRSWMEHSAKITGVYAPVKHEHITMDYIEKQIALLEVELGDVAPGEDLEPPPRRTQRAPARKTNPAKGTTSRRRTPAAVPHD
jgi:hypothetical protein